MKKLEELFFKGSGLLIFDVYDVETDIFLNPAFLPTLCFIGHIKVGLISVKYFLYALPHNSILFYNALDSKFIVQFIQHQEREAIILPTNDFLAIHKKK